MAEKKQLTDEQRAAAAERMRKAREKKKEQMLAEKEKQERLLAKEESSKEPKMFDEATVKRMIAEALIEQSNSKPQIVQFQQEKQRVTMLWQAPVADYNVLDIGDNGRYGRITGQTGVVYVPKDELSSVLDERMRKFIDSRWMLILDGLDEDERIALNCKYSDGEVLNRDQFYNIEKLGEQMLTIFPLLCKQHMEIVAQRYAESYINGNQHGIKRDLMVKLNEISKKYFPDGLFVGIIERMNNDELGR